MYQNKRIKLGFIGIGLMGKPMVLRLLLAEYEVFVWNRSLPAISQVSSAGAIPCESPAEVAEKADVILLCLANTQAVVDTVNKPAFLEALDGKSGKLIVDHSSISPAATKQLAAQVQSRGACWIDAPVSGGVPGAEQGSLVVMAGGDKTALERISPLIASYASRVTHMGATGSGQTTKLCNQVIVGCNISAIAEAIRLAKAAGVDAAKLTEALAGGFADSLPFQIFGKRMAEETETPVSIKIETMLKDLNGAVGLARELDVALALSGLAASQMQGRCEDGDAERCITSMGIAD